MRDSSLPSLGSPTVLLLALFTSACGDDAGLSAHPSTETDGEGAEPGGSSDSSQEPESGNDGGSTTITDDTDDTGDTDTSGEETVERHRIVFSAIGPAGPAGITSYLMYSATPDFEQVKNLTPTLPYPVDLQQARPMLHADHRHVAFVRDRTVYAADVWTGEMVGEWFASDGVVRMRWSPVEPVLLWTREGGRLWRGTPGSEADMIFDLVGDATPIGQIFFEWSPLGDRLVLSSRPDGAQSRKVWVMNADGSEPGIVASPFAGVNSFFAWTASGDRLVASGNIIPDYPGEEIVVGERDGYEMISHPSGNVSGAVLSGDATRVLYLAGNGMFSVNVDGTGSTLIGPPASLDGPIALIINDAGTWAARTDAGMLRVTPTTLHAPTVIEESGVDGRTVSFEPGGTRLAYLRASSPDGPSTLWRVDGNGTAEVSHTLPQGFSVRDYAWAGGGLRYAVAHDDGNVLSIHHTAGGDTPMFVPDLDEDQVDWVESGDGDLLVLRTQRVGGTGRLCAFDVSDPASWLELGCREYSGENIFVGVATDPDAP